jgi:CRP-like cAMP-binding protein
VYFIVKGEATVERDSTSLATLHDGEVFGEAALLTRQPRNATLRAASALDVVVVSRDAFQQLLGHLPGVRQAMQEITKARSIRAEAVSRQDVPDKPWASSAVNLEV